MRQEAGLVLWLAGNQFFAMDAVVRAFQAQNPAISVGLITLPPGLLLEAIEKGGWTYGSGSYPGRPDVYASVNYNVLQLYFEDAFHFKSHPKLARPFAWTIEDSGSSGSCQKAFACRMT
jgi:hypothetical protein